MIASHARPEGVDTLYPSLGSAAFQARSDRRADARHRLSCVCVQGRTPSGRIAAPDSLDQSAGRLWEEPRTMQLAELVGGGMLTPRIEVGGRYDGGDAETGAGLVVGGSLGYAVPGLGADAGRQRRLRRMERRRLPAVLPAAGRSWSVTARGPVLGRDHHPHGRKPVVAARRVGPGRSRALRRTSLPLAPWKRWSQCLKLR